MKFVSHSQGSEGEPWLTHFEQTSIFSVVFDILAIFRSSDELVDIKNKIWENWRNNSVLKNTCCSYKEPDFNI